MITYGVTSISVTILTNGILCLICWDVLVSSHYQLSRWMWHLPASTMMLICLTWEVPGVHYIGVSYKLGYKITNTHLYNTNICAIINYEQYGKQFNYNKANLRDLIAATGLVILLKFYPNHRFFSPCDLEIWWMTLENNRAPLLYYIKLCASFQI